jgi:hypothetical protein
MTGGRDKVSLILPLLGIICAGGIAFLAYELGSYQAGYAVLDVRREARANETRLAERDRTIESLRRQIAILETAREIDRETYALVEQNLEQLEGQIQSQEEELAFYQGIVSPEDGSAGLRIQSIDIEPLAPERHFLIRFVLVQAIVHSGRVTGGVELAVLGTSDDGVDAVLDLATLVGDESFAEISYDFRYFQTIEREVLLPPGFAAESVELRISPSEPRGAGLVQNYSWDVLSAEDR